MTLPAPGLARLTQSFALILRGLCDAAAARMSKPHTRQQQAAFPLMMLLWSRLCRTIRRFAALANRPDILAPPRIRVKSETRKPSERQRLPTGFGWVVKLLPQAAVFGSQLQHLLTDPEMAALIEANPHAARLLRPLCRMLAIPPSPDLPPALFQATRAAPAAQASAATAPPPPPPPPPPPSEPGSPTWPGTPSTATFRFMPKPQPA